MDLSCIMLQWANIKKWGQSSGGQFHTNHCIFPPKPWVGAFVYRNVGKVNYKLFLKFIIFPIFTTFHLNQQRTTLFGGEWGLTLPLGWQKVKGSVVADCKVDVFCTHNFLEQFFCNKGENKLHNFEILQHFKNFTRLSRGYSCTKASASRS